MPSQNRSHFIANIEVTRITQVEEEVREPGRGNPRIIVHRSKSNLARIVIADDTVEGLVAKANKHLALVDDNGDINEGRVTRGE